jgi:hypothetical protein
VGRAAEHGATRPLRVKDCYVVNTWRAHFMRATDFKCPLRQGDVPFRLSQRLWKIVDGEGDVDGIV